MSGDCPNFRGAGNAAPRRKVVAAEMGLSPLPTPEIPA